MTAWANRLFSADGSRTAFGYRDLDTGRFILVYTDDIPRPRIVFKTQEAIENAMRAWVEEGRVYSGIWGDPGVNEEDVDRMPASFWES